LPSQNTFARSRTPTKGASSLSKHAISPRRTKICSVIVKPAASPAMNFSGVGAENTSSEATVVFFPEG